MNVSVADPSSWYPSQPLECSNLGVDKIEREGFLMFGGHLREVRQVHRTQSGVQIELYKGSIVGKAIV